MALVSARRSGARRFRTRDSSSVFRGERDSWFAPPATWQLLAVREPAIYVTDPVIAPWDHCNFWFRFARHR